MASVRWLGRRKLAQTVLCTLAVLVLAMAGGARHVEASSEINSAEEFTALFLEENADILDVLWWPETVAYSESRTPAEVERETIVIQFDSGVAYLEYPWLKDYLYTRWGLVVQGQDVVGDNIGPFDDEDVEFWRRHGTLGAMVMGAMGATVMPFRVGLSSDAKPTLTDLKLAMELAMQRVEDIALMTGREISVVANFSLGFWKVSVSRALSEHWFGRHGEGTLFPLFVEEWSTEIEAEGYCSDSITHEELLYDSALYGLATDWLFDAIYVRGSLMEDLSPGDGKGAWQEITQMRDRGWMTVGASGNRAIDGIYPARLDETEAVEEVRFTEEGAVFPLLHEDWAQLTAPSNLSVYNPDEDEWLELVGSSFSTTVASAVYAKVWGAAPSLTDIELNDIVLRTAEPFTCECSRRETTFEKLFIMPYRAIRVASVYQDIKRAVSAHRWGRTDSAALRERVREALNDLQDGPTFADVGAYEDIFPGGATGEMQPLETVLDILIEKSMELVPGDRLEEAFSYSESSMVAATAFGPSAAHAENTLQRSWLE